MMELYPGDKPSMKNIYESKYLDTVQKDRFDRGIELNKKSKNPGKTGVISLPTTASTFSEIRDDEEDNMMSLTGEKINTKDFNHNNMQPFLKGNITQNTNVEKFTQKLDFNTGVDKFYIQKKEIEPFSLPVAGYHNINGSKSESDFLKRRLVLSEMQQSVTPFESIRVGPGLNHGYTNKGSGGFQQNNSLEYARPRVMNELRSKINQKTGFFPMDYRAPIKGTEQRGVVNPLRKNKPERTYIQKLSDLIGTSSYIKKNSLRPELAVKAVNRRNTHKEYTGPVKFEFLKGMSLGDDHGKSNIMVYNTERQETQTKTVVSNVTSTIKAIVSPVMDVLKYSTKEYLVDSARSEGGNAVAQIPNKLTVHDPNDLLKTTVKETTVHDSDTLNLTGHDGTYSALNDIAKTTVKETLVHDSTFLNVKTANENSYLANDDKAKTTNKETLPVIDTVRNIGKAVYKVHTYDPEVVAKKTIKETTIKGNNELGFIGGVINSILGGYATSEVELKNTHKQFTVENQEIGIAKSINDHRQVSREADENMEIDPTREQQLIAAGHTPNAGGVNIPVDKKNINMKTNKLIGDSIPIRKTGNVNVIYQNSPNVENVCKLPASDKKNAFVNRLDGNVMTSLTKNDFNININPIVGIVS